MQICRLVPILLIAGLCACGDSTADTPDSGSDAGVVDATAADAAPRRDGSTVVDAGSADGGFGAPVGLCPENAELLYYSLAAPSVLPSVSDLELTNLPASVKIVGAGDGVSNSARFAVCKDPGGHYLLRSILWKSWELSAPTSYVYDSTIIAPTEEILETDDGVVMEIRLPPSHFDVQGLDAAIAGDLDPLEIRLIYESGLLVLGHPGFVALAPGRVSASSIDYTSLTVVTGTLELGDVFGSLECGFEETPLTTSFMMGTATFDLKACTFLGGGETTGYRIYRLSVQDSNAELSAAEQQRFDFAGEAEVDSVMNYVWNHHNACDSFHIALPHADYAASTAPLAGCGAVVPDAPPRDFSDDPSGPVLYRIRYHGGEWTDGSIPGCSHYMFCGL